MTLTEAVAALSEDQRRELDIDWANHARWAVPPVGTKENFTIHRLWLLSGAVPSPNPYNWGVEAYNWWAAQAAA